MYRPDINTRRVATWGVIASSAAWGFKASFQSPEKIAAGNAYLPLTPRTEKAVRNTFDLVQRYWLDEHDEARRKKQT